MNRPTAARFGAAAVTGALLAAARPPLDLGPLACVAFIPLFVAWRDQRARTTAASARKAFSATAKNVTSSTPPSLASARPMPMS